MRYYIIAAVEGEGLPSFGESFIAIISRLGAVFRTFRRL